MTTASTATSSWLLVTHDDDDSLRRPSLFPTPSPATTTPQLHALLRSLVNDGRGSSSSSSSSDGGHGDDARGGVNVSAALLRLTPPPPPPPHQQGQQRKRTVIIAYDGSTSSRRALEWALVNFAGGSGSAESGPPPCRMVVLSVGVVDAGVEDVLYGFMDSLLARTGFAGVEVQPTLPTTPGSASGGGITTSPIGGAVTAEAHIDPHYLIRTSTHISAAQSANKIKFALEQSVGCLLALENSGALRTGAATTPPVDLVAVAAFDPAAAIEAVARAYAQADSTSGAEREDEAEGEAGRHVSSAETSGGTVGRERWVVQGEKPTVVLGSRGHGLVERVLVGSTTSELLHSAYACHLVVVK